MRKKFVFNRVLLLVVLVSAVSLTGCKDQSNNAVTTNSEKVETVSMYISDPWQSGIVDPSWSDPIAQEITEKTGISVEITTVKSSDANAQLNIMLASGELPDLISSSDSTRRHKLITGGYVQPLDDLIEKYGPNIKKNYAPYMDAWRASDGKVYGLGTWNWTEPTKYALNLSVNTLHMRYDILKELGYSKLDRKNEGDSFITMDEYMNLLDQVKNQYPDMFPVLFDAYNAYDTLIRSRGVQVDENTLFENGQAHFIYKNPYTLETIKTLNNLYMNDYAPKGMATFKRENNQTLIANGQVFSTLGSVDGLNEAQAALSADNEEKRMVMFYLVDEPSTQSIFVNQMFSPSTPTMLLSKDSKNAEAAMKLLDFLATDEGSLLLHAGVEGVTYTQADDGTNLPTDEMAKAYAVWDTNVIKKTGVGAWFNIFPGIAGLDENGNANDINAQKVFEEDRWVVYNNKDWERFDYSNIVSPVGDLTKEKNPDAYEAYIKISGYIKDRLTRAVVADSPEESEAEWNIALQQMESDGLSTLTAALQENWVHLAKTLNNDPDELFRVVADQE